MTALFEGRSTVAKPAGRIFMARRLIPLVVFKSPETQQINLPGTNLVAAVNRRLPSLPVRL